MRISTYKTLENEKTEDVKKDQILGQFYDKRAPIFSA